MQEWILAVIKVIIHNNYLGNYLLVYVNLSKMLTTFRLNLYFYSSYNIMYFNYIRQNLKTTCSLCLLVIHREKYEKKHFKREAKHARFNRPSQVDDI